MLPVPISRLMGEVEFSQLPKLPADIDPDDIPPFYSESITGGRFHYNRPLTAEERQVYYNLKLTQTTKSQVLRVSRCLRLFLCDSKGKQRVNYHTFFKT